MSNKFKNRVSTNTNRRKLKIISQSADELIADIERFDSDVLEEGTPITAEVMNAWDDDIADAKQKATAVYTDLESAKSNAEQALAVANEVAEEIAAKRGTTVQVSGSPVNVVSFVLDPQQQINAKLDKVLELSSANKNMGVDQNGNIVAQDFVTLGNAKLYEQTEQDGTTSIVFEFEDEVVTQPEEQEEQQ